MPSRFSVPEFGPIDLIFMEDVSAFWFSVLTVPGPCPVIVGTTL